MAVMSVANLMTLTGLPALSKTGLYEAWIQISVPPLPTRRNLSAKNSPLFRRRQNSRYSAGLAVGLVDEHAVVAALDLAERVAQGLQEVSRWR
jgi:hypothetical protein